MIGLLIVAFVILIAVPVLDIAVAPFNNLPPVSQPVANCETPLIRPPATVSGVSTLGNWTVSLTPNLPKSAFEEPSATNSSCDL